MHRTKQIKVVISLVVSMVLVTGCGGTQSPACDIPEQGSLVVYATNRVNPDSNGRALPTIIRIYQLSELGALELASFEEIWRSPEETLGDTLVVADEVTVYPGERRVRQFERDSEANYLVGVAIVRRPSGISWRTVLELPISAEAQRCAELQEDPDEAPPIPPVSRASFRVDGYSIEGELQLDRVEDCENGDLGCLRDRLREMGSEELGGAAEETPEVDGAADSSGLGDQAPDVQDQMPDTQDQMQNVQDQMPDMQDQMPDLNQPTLPTGGTGKQ